MKKFSQRQHNDIYFNHDKLIVILLKCGTRKDTVIL